MKLLVGRDNRVRVVWSPSDFNFGDGEIHVGVVGQRHWKDMGRGTLLLAKGQGRGRYGEEPLHDIEREHTLARQKALLSGFKTS